MIGSFWKGYRSGEKRLTGIADWLAADCGADARGVGSERLSVERSGFCESASD
jgi:hypothetical protein